LAIAALDAAAADHHSPDGDPLLVYYPNSSAPPLFQSAPLPYLRDRPSESWTRSLADYYHAADCLVGALLHNAALGAKPKLALTINVLDELSAEDHKAHWSECCRRLKAAGIVGHWVREVNRRNRLHYHLSLLNDTGPDECRRIVEAALPRTVPYRLHVQACDDYRGWFRYVCKAKTRRQDQWAGKRVLFRPSTGLFKHGAIGRYWVKPKKQLWAEGKPARQQAQEGARTEGFHRVFKAAVDLVGDWFRPAEIRFRLAFYAQTDEVQAWSKQLADDRPCFRPPGPPTTVQEPQVTVQEPQVTVQEPQVTAWTPPTTCWLPIWRLNGHYQATGHAGQATETPDGPTSSLKGQLHDVLLPRCRSP
jgi:hypothetical protein